MTLPLSELLDLAGFRVHGRRADCIHCDGRARFTVAFNDEAYFCHRCKRGGNARTLARGLGMTLAPETREAREKRQRAARFDEWLNVCYLLLIDRLGHLTRRAELAKKSLAQSPSCEPAWSALADFYHSEATLCGALDVLSFEKLSPWVEVPITRDNLFAAFEDAFERIGARYAA
jgi:hypothetical protein